LTPKKTCFLLRSHGGRPWGLSVRSLGDPFGNALRVATIGGRVVGGLVLACWLNVSLALGQVQVDRFFPPAVGVGQSVVIQAEGKFPSWPIEVVVDRSDVSIKAEKDSGKLKVEVAQGVAPGIAWVRVLDSTSASGLVPLLIEPTAPIEEVEPNQTLDEATLLEMPCSLVGRLSKSGEVDTFRIPAKPGRTLVVSMIGNQVLRSPMDAVLQLVDESGHVLRQADDQRGLDPQLVYQVVEDGDLFVRLFAFPETPNSTIGFAGAATFVYELRVTTDAFVDHVLPLTGQTQLYVGKSVGGWNLPADVQIKQGQGDHGYGRSVFLPTSLGWQWQSGNEGNANHHLESTEAVEIEQLPCLFSGRIEKAGEVDRMRIAVTQGEKYRAKVHARRSGMLLDSVLRVIDFTDGTELATNDDQTRGKYDAQVDFTAKKTGMLEVQISDLVGGYGMRHAYTVEVHSLQPSFGITVAADHFAVPGGGSVEIPVAISRSAGDASRLRISLAGLPPGVACEPVVSEPKGDSAKAVKLQMTASDGITHQGKFQVVAVALGEDDQPSGEPVKARYDLAGICEVDDLWLTVHPK